MDYNQVQQILMSLTPENQQKFYEQRDAFYNETEFTHELPANFDHYKVFCGTAVNEITLGITAKNYVNLFFGKLEKYTVGNVAFICQASESATFLQYLQCYGKAKTHQELAESWAYMRESFEVMTAQVNAIITPTVEAMITSIQRKQNAIIKGVHDTGSYKKTVKLNP